MRPANNDKQRRHRKATSDAMKRMTWACEACGRGQNQRPIDISGVGDLLRVCRYCGHEAALSATQGAPAVETVGRRLADAGFQVPRDVLEAALSTQPSVEATQPVDHECKWRDVLMTLASELELPRSEPSGPPDDADVYLRPYRNLEEECARETKLRQDAYRRGAALPGDAGRAALDYINEHEPRCYTDIGGNARRTAFREIRELLEALPASPQPVGDLGALVERP